MTTIEHKTYVASKCIRCHDDMLRICILHNDCEHEWHGTMNCDRIVRDVEQARRRLRVFDGKE